MFAEQLEDRRLLAVVVDTAADAVSTTDGVTSLREAISIANSQAGGETITFSPSVFSGGANSVIRLTQGELLITDTLTIDASSATDVVITGDALGNDMRVAGTFISDIDASSSSLSDNRRVMHFTAGTGDLTLRGLTVTGGRDTSTSPSTNGGGGIRFSSSGELSLIDTAVSGNVTTDAFASGGGVRSIAGSVIVVDSTISGNRSTGSLGSGGGIATSSGAVTVTGSTISGNTTRQNGGGISAGGSLSVFNSTVFGNTANSGGGGLSAGNVSITLSNSIIAGNGGNSAFPDLSRGSSSTLAIRHNLIGNNAGASLTPAPIGSPDANGNLIGTSAAPIDPMLGPLADNGGPTRTHRPSFDSPVVDAGSIGLIAPVGVSSSTPLDFFSVQNLINSSGLPSPTLEGYASQTHQTSSVSNAWVTDQPFSGDYFASGGTPPVLTFNLGRLQTITDMVVWGYRLLGGDGSTNEARSYQVRFSTDGGTTFGPSVSISHSTTGLSATTLDLRGQHLADVVQVTITDNGGGNRVGLSEVRFIDRFDQRGRPYQRDSFDGIDIGAVELSELDFTIPTQGLVVSTIDDELDIDFSDDDLSLREAIAIANAVSGANTITFDPLVFTGNISSRIRLALGELVITDTLTIDASSANEVVITGDRSANDELVINTFITDVDASLAADASSLDDNSRVLNFTAGTGDLTLRGLTITGGRNTSTDSATRGGGGVRFGSVGSLNLSNSSVSGNGTTADLAFGGGIRSLTGDVTLVDSTVSGNRTSGSSAAGGGIFASSGDLTVIGSTISGNTAQGSGGAAYSSGSVRVLNSTIVGNTALGSGGGVIVGNSPSSTPNQLTAQNSIIASNIDNGQAPDIRRDGTSTLAIRHSLIGTNVGTTLIAAPIGSPDANGNFIGTSSAPIDPMLGSLASNGGPTMTHLPFFDSPVVNAGSIGLVAPVSVSSSTQLLDTFPAQNLINSSGLPSPTLEGYSDQTHATSSDSNAWVTNQPFNGDYFELGGPDPVLTFNLGGLRSITDMVVWGYRLSGGNGSTNEARSYTIELSSDGGNTFGSPIFVSHPEIGLGSATLDLGGRHVANVVRVTITDNGGGNRVGLSEVRFIDRFDQRGTPFSRSVGSIIDIGAVELDILDPELLVVTTTADQLDFSDPAVSLREAVFAANFLAGANTITFDAHVFTGDENSLIRLTRGELEITDSLTINASAATDVVVSGDAAGNDTLVDDTYITDVDASLAADASSLNDNSRVLNFTASSGDLTLNGLAITGGRVASDLGGGGIRFSSSDTLRLTGSNVSGNSTTSDNADGGGVFTNGGNVMLTNSTVSGNSTTGARADGGGIRTSSGSVTLTNSTVSGNSTAGASADGGGIRTFSGNVTLTNSTVSGNSTAGSSAQGGGIYTVSGEVTLTNSTISGNSTAGSSSEGGGIFTSQGSVTLNNSTVSGNSATGSRGGGVFSAYYSSSGGSLTVSHSIIAGNTDDGFAPDLRPAFRQTLTVTHSLIGDNTGAGLDAAPIGSPDGNGNLVGTTTAPIDPMLGPLADNGGPTLTHALPITSPAVNAGNPSFPAPPNFDQRGDGFDRVAFGRIDIGAYELGGSDLPIPPQGLIVSTTADELDLDFSVGDLSLREAITFANGAGGANTITFDPSVFTGGLNSVIRLSLGELEITDSLTIDASAATDVVLSGDAMDNDTLVDDTFITDVDASLAANASSLNDNSRVLNFSASSGDLTLSGLTITGGRVTSNLGGGGIRFSSSDTQGNCATLGKMGD